jgi:hypothetical protein
MSAEKGTMSAEKGTTSAEKVSIVPFSDTVTAALHASPRTPDDTLRRLLSD